MALVLPTDDPQLGGTMNINEMPDDCIALIIEALSKDSTLRELVQKAFVCEKWFRVVAKYLATWKGTSLKLFHSELNMDTYKQLLNDLKLKRIDLRFELTEREIGDMGWKGEDHLVLQLISDTASELIIDGLAEIFSQIEFLLIYTLNLDYVQMLKACPELTTLALIELPDSRKIQQALWIQLAEMPTLKNLHIIHMDGFIPLDVELLRPVLARLESFTLANYTQNNGLELVGCLDAEKCRRICMGRFASYPLAVDFRQQMPHALRSRLFILEPPTANYRRFATEQAAALRVLGLEERNIELVPMEIYNNELRHLIPHQIAQVERRINQERRRYQAFRQERIRLTDMIVQAIEDLAEDAEIEELRAQLRHLIQEYVQGRWRPAPEFAAHRHESDDEDDFDHIRFEINLNGR